MSRGLGDVYKRQDMHNVELTDQGFTATEKKASVTLSFEGIPESETYFILKGLQFSEEGKTLTQSKSRLHIDVTCGKITKMITFLTRKNLLASSNMFPAALLFFSQKRSMIGIRYNRLHHTYIFIIWKRYFFTLSLSVIFSPRK